MAPTTRLGFELELLAPPGASRLDLARALAAAHGGRVVPGFHLDAEPSAAPGIDVFHHLTPAFDVVDAGGAPVCRLVDDVTIQDDLDRSAPPEPGWFRVVADDRRLLRLVGRHCDPTASPQVCLEPIATLFGTRVTRHGALTRVDDEAGATVAIAAGLPGERHRPCEVITPPIAADHERRLDALLAPARDLGFTVPAEAAVHLHADAAPLRDARTLRNLIRLVVAYGDVLRWLVGTNPRCRRLGPLPEALADAVEADGWAALGWPEARDRVAAARPAKYADLNLAHLVAPPPGKDTVEWRILPGAVDARPVVEAAELFEAILRRAADPMPVPWSGGAVEPGVAGAEQLLAELGAPADLGRWLGRQRVDVELPV